MNRVRLPLRRLARVLGPLGMVGVGLVILAGGIYLTGIVPASDRMAQLREEMNDSRKTMKRMAAEDLSGADAFGRPRLESFYGFFPPRESAADMIGKIFATARAQSLALEQGNYKLVRNQDGRLASYYIDLPFKGSYLQVRNFAVGVLNEIPALAMEDIGFQRQAVGSTVVEGKIRFVLYVRG